MPPVDIYDFASHPYLTRDRATMDDLLSWHEVLMGLGVEHITHFDVDPLHGGLSGDFEKLLIDAAHLQVSISAVVGRIIAMRAEDT